MRTKLFLVLIMISFAVSIPAIAQIDTIFRSFSLSQVEEGVLINFTIRGGITCSGVTIERADDSMNFSEIYEFAGVCGALNTDESYSFLDERPVINQPSQYRLNLGSLGLYSSVLNIQFIDYNSEGISIFPNPCKNLCKVYFSNQNQELLEIRFFDRLGGLILKDEIKGEEWELKNTSLPAGIYYLQILKNAEIKYFGKLLII
jgi:hypothetical protein